MIQSMSAARSVASERAEPVQMLAPSPASAPLPADAANLLDAALQAFGTRMAQLEETSDAQAEGPVQALPEQLVSYIDTQSQSHELPAEATPETPQPEQSAAEQWLLGMLGQQQLVVGAREVAVALAGAAQLPAGMPSSQQMVAAPLEQMADQQRAAALSDTADPVLPPGRESTSSLALAVAGEARRSAHGSEAAVAQSPLATPPATAEPHSLATAELLAPAATTEGVEPLMTLERAPLAQTTASEGSLRLQAPQARWGEQMLQALREHVELQLQQKVQRATIRLDPPELGAMEILLSHESGRLTVQLSAAQADVARLLQQTSDRLRQELVSQHFVQVSVQVGADGQGQQGQPRQGAPRANHEPTIAGQQPADPPEDQTARGLHDVLVTV